MAFGVLKNFPFLHLIIIIIAVDIRPAAGHYFFICLALPVYACEMPSFTHFACARDKNEWSDQRFVLAEVLANFRAQVVDIVSVL